MNAFKRRIGHTRSGFKPLAGKASLGQHRPAIEDGFVEIRQHSPVASNNVGVNISNRHESNLKFLNRACDGTDRPVSFGSIGSPVDDADADRPFASPSCAAEECFA